MFNNINLTYSGWAFSGQLTDGVGAKRLPIPKICHTYSTIMKLGTVIPYIKKANHVAQLLSSADISIFSPEISKFCYIKKYSYKLCFHTKLLILLTFFESFNTYGYDVSKIGYSRPSQSKGILK